MLGKPQVEDGFVSYICDPLRWEAWMDAQSVSA